MYPLLCISSCLAGLFIVQLVSTLCRDITFSALMRWCTREKLMSSPDALFALRMFPIAVGVLFAASLALPSFLLLEPRDTREPMSLRLLLAAILGAALCTIVAVRFLHVLISTRKTTRAWIHSASRLHTLGIPGQAHVVDGHPGLFAVTGIFRPRIFIGRKTLEALSPVELRAAVQHEIAHIRAWDNFRQLLIRITPALYPGSGQTSLESLWSVSAELRADDAALRSGVPALDLASALVRVARISHNHASRLPLAASHLIPEPSMSAMALRISHLSEKIDNPGSRPHHFFQLPVPIWPATVLAVVLGYACCLRWLLPAAHKLIEIIVR
jgi:Zn-dependent protease with chaperone function